MNYIKQINAFWDWLEINGLSYGEVVLYLAILHRANRTAWKEEFTIANTTLLNLCGISNNKSLSRMRNKLVQLKLITYTGGSKGKAGTYTVAKLYLDTCSDTTLDTTLDTCSDTCSDTINKHKQILKQKRKQDIPPLSPQGGKSPEAKRSGASDSVKLDKLIDEQPEELQEPLREFVKMRTRIKKPLTPHALELNIKQLYRMSGDPKERVDIVEQSVMRSYQGFFPVGRARDGSGSGAREEPDVFTQAMNEPW